MSLRCAASLTAVLAAALAVAVAPLAGAKGLEDARACGPGGCASLSHEAALAVFGGGPPASAPRGPVPFYELRARMFDPAAEDGRGPEVTTIVVPSRRLVRTEDGAWTRAQAPAVRALRREARSVEPFAPRRFDGVAERRPAESRVGGGSGAGSGSGTLAVVFGALVVAAAGVALTTTARRRRAAPQG